MFVDSEELRESAKQLDIIQTECSTPYHMWQPTPALFDNIHNIENLISRNDSDISLSTKCRVCVDVGCGAGRDAVFLGLRDRWQVFAVDNMPKALKRVEHLRDRCEVSSDSVQAVLLDVKKDPYSLLKRFTFSDNRDNRDSDRDSDRDSVRDNSVSSGSAGRRVDLVLVGRFFSRPLLELGILKDMISPGGFIFFHHFLDGVQHHSIGHPSSPNDYALKGELFKSFAGWEVVMNDEESTLSDGRPMVTFIAQKPRS